MGTWDIGKQQQQGCSGVRVSLAALLKAFASQMDQKPTHTHKAVSDFACLCVCFLMCARV